MSPSDSNTPKDPEARSVGALVVYAIALLASGFLFWYWRDDDADDWKRLVLAGAAAVASIVMFVMELRRPPGKSP